MPIEIAGLVGWLAWLLGVILAGCAVLEAVEVVELLAWRRSGDAAAGSADARSGDAKSDGVGSGSINSGSADLASAARPFVSFHVPICSEPPDVVTKTLMALRDLDYDAFEVLVVDNNTKDEQLWRPVEQLCRELGPRFRFFHLPVWPGFKAGALNFALRNTASHASLIGVIDADYESAPNYLIDIVGHFVDPGVAFVQTPQDYRNWSLGRFSRTCHWEYWQVFAVSMVLRNRRNAILMHGTMSLVRKEMLERAGAWAEWCLTEDSELGLRILAQGHSGVYVSQTYGRGLIPFTYRDYKAQRRRWVIGGVQQLKRHLRLFLPSVVPGAVAASRLTVGQKLHYLQGWLPWFRDGVVVAAAPFALAAGIAALLGFVGPDALAWLGVGMICVVAQLVVRQVIIYGLYLSLPWRDALGSSIAGCSLSWSIGWGWIAGASKAHQVFRRTPKRPQKMAGWLASAQEELVVGACMLALGLAIAFRFGLSAAGTVACLWAYAALFLPAVWMARLSSRQPDGAMSQD
jgi:cellulose synthase/poly-beta-1,6-N-acetylglucosamine synthase-like glycosyltransferase